MKVEEIVAGGAVMIVAVGVVGVVGGTKVVGMRLGSEKGVVEPIGCGL